VALDRTARGSVFLVLSVALVALGAGCAKTPPGIPVVTHPKSIVRAPLPSTPDGVAKAALMALAKGDRSALASLVATGVDTSTFQVPSATQTVSATVVAPFTHRGNPLKRHPEITARGVTQDSVLAVVMSAWDSGTPGVGVNFFLVDQSRPGAPWLIVWRGPTPP
jgi:hypothetical protein